MITKEDFLYTITDLIRHTDDVSIYGMNNVTAGDLLEYLENFEKTPEKKKVLITENGLKILEWMRENEESFHNDFTAAAIGKGMFTSGRAISGSLRKMVTEGFLEKTIVDKNKTTHYSLTSFGKEYTI